MTASGSFEDFIEQFKKRHPKDFAGIAGKSAKYQESREMFERDEVHTNKDGLVYTSEFKPVSEVSVPFVGVIGVETFKPLESSVAKPSVVPDRMTQASGYDWADVWDDTSGEAEVIE